MEASLIMAQYISMCFQLLFFFIKTYSSGSQSFFFPGDPYLTIRILTDPSLPSNQEFKKQLLRF